MKPVSYLIEYAKGQVGRPYWCGTYGKIANQALLDYKRKQYPKMYPNPGNPPFTSQFGKKVHDCNGLMYAASVCDTPDSVPKAYPTPYYGVPKLYEHCVDKGGITQDIVLVEGEFVFRNSLGHVGVYSEGYVYNAMGHAYGVVKEKYNYKSWTHHGKFKEMYEYSTSPKIVTVNCKLPFLEKGAKGDAVKVWQTIVGTKADGDFGKLTDEATKEFQKKEKIEVDGQVGKDSWTHGLNGLS